MRIPVDELKKIFTVDFESGNIYWAKTQGPAKAGALAGSINNMGYRLIKLKGKSYYGHRIIWAFSKGEWPENEIDHINHIRDDNRLVNLREVCHRENGVNCALFRTNTSGVTGVVLSGNRWMAQIRVGDKRIYLGQFKNFEDAVEARRKANMEYGFHYNHGKIAAIAASKEKKE